MEKKIIMANKNMKIKLSVLSDLLDAIPTTWLDPLLTGENAVIGQPPYNCQDIELLLQAIKRRMGTRLRGEK